tara:strand:- start:368 stop:577 length:210 start_codon:yes stop_codon:yes gene_type:complete
MTKLDPNSISLDKPSKSFEFEKVSRDLDKIDDANVLRDIAKCYIKLYLKQQETLSSIGVPPAPISDGNP